MCRNFWGNEERHVSTTWLLVFNYFWNFGRIQNTKTAPQNYSYDCSQPVNFLCRGVKPLLWVHNYAVHAGHSVCVLVSRAVHAPVNGTTAIPWRSSRRRLSLLEKLRGCQDAWCPGAPWDREGAHAAIRGAPAGVREELSVQWRQVRKQEFVESIISILEWIPFLRNNDQNTYLLFLTCI